MHALISNRPAFELTIQRPAAWDFVARICREMRSRGYSDRAVQSHRSALIRFLRWLGAPPHAARREDICDYLDLLIEGGASYGWASDALSAIKIGFDRIHGADLAAGLEVPRRGRVKPETLSTSELLRLLKAAPSLRDKLLLGLLYATGLRVSEVLALRRTNVDLAERTIRARARVIPLPKAFAPLLEARAAMLEPAGPLFGVTRRAAEAILARARAIARIEKRGGSEMLRRSFIAHTLDNGTDPRFIHRFLGYVRFDSTVLYARLEDPPKRPAGAVPAIGEARGAADVRSAAHCGVAPASLLASEARSGGAAELLRLRIQPSGAASLHVVGKDGPIALEGIVVRVVREGWVTVEIPPLEAWAVPMAALTEDQRAKLAHPAFFNLLEAELVRWARGAADVRSAAHCGVAPASLLASEARSGGAAEMLRLAGQQTCGPPHTAG